MVGTVRLTVSGPGTYRAKDAGGFDDLAVPPTATGRMTWRWSVVETDQPADVRGFVTPTAELIGEPTQTQDIAVPSIETKAQPSVRPGGTMTDTAIVSGTLPQGGMALSFAAYDVPFGADGQPVWPGEPGDYSGLCTPENLVWHNHDRPQVITTPGEYTSPAVPTDAYAMTLWVERGSAIPTAGEGEPATILEGECGVPHETTYGMKVTTKAQTPLGGPVVAPGDELSDTVRLEGALPAGGSVKVDLYQWPAGDDAVCSAETRVWSSAATPLTGGMFPRGMELDLRAEGQTFTVPDLAEGTNLGFVETTTDATGRELSRGRCGEPDETVTVIHPAVSSVHTLPETGGDTPLPVLVASAAALVLLGGAAILVGQRRRQVTVTG